MTMRSRTLVAVAAVLAIGIAAFFWLDRSYHFTGGHGAVVDALIARNVAARGGADAWRAIESLRLSGQMDLGQELHVPYVLEQKRPGKMCLEFEFNEETATQCVAGTAGWKLLPYMGRSAPEPMADLELREIAGAISIDGLLLDSDRRGYKIRLVGNEIVNGVSTSKLEVRLPSGALRWVYLDDATGLEVKLEAVRTVRGQDRLVETYFSDWQFDAGLLIAHRQETRDRGVAESHFMTVENVSINPAIADQRFVMPTVADAGVAVR